MSTEKKTEIKEVVLTGIGIAVGIQLYDFVFKGEMDLFRFAFMLLLCPPILFLFRKIRKR